VGAEAENYKNPALQIDLLVNHIMHIRKNIPHLSHAKCIFIPESNLAFEGVHADHNLRRVGMPELITMYEDDQKAGIRTNRELKKMMALALGNMLVQERVCFYSDFFVLGTSWVPETMKTEIITQLENYTRVIKPAKSLDQDPIETFHGKWGGKSDDLAIALQLNFIMKNRFFAKEDVYGKYYKN
jgi:hypothetical protein